MNIISKEAERRLSVVALQQLIQQSRGQLLPPNHHLTTLVGSIGSQIVRRNQMEHLPPAPWKFMVIQSNIPNAVSLPDGTVVVFTGFLPPVGRSHDALAAVLAHEISH